MEFKLIAILAIVIAISSVGTGSMVYAKHLSDQDRYDSGYKDGCADANSGNGLGYMQSTAYLGHSDLYHQGYKFGLKDCASGYDDQQQPSYVKVSGHGKQNIDNSDQNNRNQAEGQASNQKVTCVTVFGNCNTTSGQAQNLQN